MPNQIGLVQGTLETAMKGLTTMIITHRLAIVQRVDRIVVMEQGVGTHSSLVAQGGVYAHLVSLLFQS